MINRISIVIPTCRPNLLTRCVESLELYSRYSHEIILMHDTHGGWKHKWDDWKPLREKSKHDIKILTTDRFDEAPLDSHWKKRGEVALHKSIEACACILNWGIAHSTCDWILAPTDDDFYYLPDWDYHLLKHMDPYNLKIAYHVKQLCPREVKGAEHKTSWIGFEHPKGSMNPKLRERTPLKVSYALEETKQYRIDKAFLTSIMDWHFGHNVGNLFHRETMLKAGGKKTLLESCDNLWYSSDAVWTSLRAFEAYGCKKCSPQNSNVLHYSGKLIDDLQDPPVIWKGQLG